MNKYRYLILSLFLAVVLSSCNSGRYFFNKRIQHPSPPEEKQRNEVDSYIEKPTRNDNLAHYPVAYDTTVSKRSSIAYFNTDSVKTAPGDRPEPDPGINHKRPMLRKVVPLVTDKFSEVAHRKKGEGRISFNPEKPITGHDKEGFILLIIIAAVLIGLGLLLYFLFDVVGLIFLILFSVAAGILIVLVLIALFV